MASITIVAAVQNILAIESSGMQKVFEDFASKCDPLVCLIDIATAGGGSDADLSLRLDQAVESDTRVFIVVVVDNPELPQMVERLTRKGEPLVLAVDLASAPCSAPSIPVDNVLDIPGSGEEGLRCAVTVARRVVSSGVEALPELLGFVETEQLEKLRAQLVNAMRVNSPQVPELAGLYHGLAEKVVERDESSRIQLGFMVQMAIIRREANRIDDYIDDLHDALTRASQEKLYGIAAILRAAMWTCKKPE